MAPKFVTKILKKPYFVVRKWAPQEVVLFLTLEVVPKLTLERPKSGTKTNSPAYIYTHTAGPTPLGLLMVEHAFHCNGPPYGFNSQGLRGSPKRWSKYRTQAIAFLHLKIQQAMRNTRRTRENMRNKEEQGNCELRGGPQRPRIGPFFFSSFYFPDFNSSFQA